MDLREGFQATKSEHELYYRGDTHWNGRGMGVGYELILSELRAMLPHAAFRAPCSYKIDVHSDASAPAQLDEMIGIDLLRSEPRIIASIDVPNAREVGVPEEYLDLETEYRRRPKALAVFTNDNPDVRGLRLVMFHTSFSRGELRNLLAEHFERAVFIRHAGPHVLAFHKYIIERERPSIVLNEIPSRYLTWDPTLCYRSEEWSDSSTLTADKRNSEVSRR